MSKQSLYGSDKFIQKGTLLIALSTEYDLTAGRVYAALEDQGHNTFHDCVFVKNDKGAEQDYSLEWFALYEGEVVTL